MKHKDRFTAKAARFISGGLMAAALVACLAPASQVFAADTVDGQAQTGVYLQADDGKLVASVPTQIDVKVNGDGSFITPSADATKIQNGSIFGIHVANIQTTAMNDFTLVDDAAGALEDDAIEFNVTPDSGAAVSLADTTSGLDLSGTDWNLDKMGGDHDAISLTTDGAINNITKDLSASQQFAQINWTFAAGPNA